MGKLKTSLYALEKKKISGCSNNSVVDFAIRAKLGVNRCATSNTPFCKGANKIVAKKADKLNSVQAIAVQRELIARGFLPKNGDDGKFEEGSKKAYLRARKKKSFRKKVRACR